MFSHRVATFYQHNQDVPATTWNINHYQGGYPIIDVFIIADNLYVKVIPSAITYIDNNTATVTFQSAQAGKAMVV